MEDAFAAGYDPALELTKTHIPAKSDLGRDGTFDEHGPWTEHLRRKEQDHIDLIVHGQKSGHYFMLIGPKVFALFFDSFLLEY